MPHESFAMFRTWINTSSVGRTRSRPSDRLKVEAIVGAGGGCEESAWDGSCTEEAELRICHFALQQLLGWNPASNSEAGRAEFEGRTYRGGASELTFVVDNCLLSLTNSRLSVSGS